MGRLTDQVFFGSCISTSISIKIKMKVAIAICIILVVINSVYNEDFSINDSKLSRETRNASPSRKENKISHEYKKKLRKLKKNKETKIKEKKKSKNTKKAKKTKINKESKRNKGVGEKIK